MPILKIGSLMKFIFLLCLGSLVFAQGLFESAQSVSSLPYEIRGNIRSGIRVDHEDDSLYYKDLYVRSNIKLKVRAGTHAYAFTDIRLEYGYAGTRDIGGVYLREAYIDLKRGPFHARLGKQIETWGRADVFSPVDQITPKDLRQAFIDPEDMRLANILLNASIQVGPPVRLQALWFPLYRANELPLTLFDLPENIRYRGLREPARSFVNSGGGLRLDLYTGEYDAAFSYLNTYGLQPGFSAELILDPSSGPGFDLYQLPWRQQLFAFDAAFNAGAWNLRSEASLLLPEDPAEHPHIPQKEIQWTLGADRSVGALRFLAEYNGKHVSNFSDPEIPQDPLDMVDYQLALYNRLIYRQEQATQHQLFLRLSLSLFHETFDMEFPFMYYFSSEEYAILPLIRVDLAEGLDLRVGASFYKGDDQTLFHLMSGLYNGCFAELKCVF